MKKLKAKAQIVHGKDQVAQPGDVLEVDDALAKKLIDAGHAEETDASATVAQPGVTASPGGAAPVRATPATSAAEKKGAGKTDTEEL